MNNEWNKMLKGEPYDALNAEILDLLFKTKDRIRQYNQLPPSDNESRETAVRAILGSCGEHPIVNSPFYCDYGCNTMWETISFPTSTLPYLMKLWSLSATMPILARM